MIGALIIYGLPLLAAGIALGGKLNKVWTFFCSSLLSFYLTISLVSVTFPLTEGLLGKGSIFMFLIVFTAVGLILTLFLYILFSLILSGQEIDFPEKVASFLQAGIAYCGALFLVVLLTFGVAPFLTSPLPGLTADMMKTTSAITRKTMSLCKMEMSEKQKQWLCYAPQNTHDLKTDDAKEETQNKASNDGMLNAVRKKVNNAERTRAINE